MTSRERCEALMEYIVETNQGWFDKERIGNDLTAILVDLEMLELLKPIIKAVVALKNVEMTTFDFKVSDSVKEKIKGWVKNE